MQRDLVNVLDVAMLLEALRTGFDVEEVAESIWMVEAPDGKITASVFSDADGTDCDCPDGQADRSCVHAALVIASCIGPIRVLHAAGGTGFRARHLGVCRPQCGNLPICRVDIGGRYVLDPDPHHYHSAEAGVVQTLDTGLVLCYALIGESDQRGREEREMSYQQPTIKHMHAECAGEYRLAQFKPSDHRNLGGWWGIIRRAYEPERKMRLTFLGEWGESSARLWVEQVHEPEECECRVLSYPPEQQS